MQINWVPSNFIGRPMSVHSLRLADLSGLSEAERSERLTQLYAQSASPNGALEFVLGQIRECERLHEMTSSEMRKSLENGTLKETASICRWLMFLDVQDRLERTASCQP